MPKIPLTDAPECERPPSGVGPLAAWFAEGVHCEIAQLEKDGGTQRYEVLSGRVRERIEATKAVYEFIVADGTRLPEDAAGRLRAGEDEYSATVVAQEANRIHIRVEGRGPLPPGIPWASLTIDDTALLRRLLEVLQETTAAPASVSELAATVFHPARAAVSRRALPETAALVGVDLNLRKILEQACGSSVTYLWGPPGTGKTHAIAHLIVALLDHGERVLVASHTHSAVDQALYEAVKDEDSQRPGPLANDPRVADGQILRLGLTPDRKIPASVRLDKVTEIKTRKLADRIADLEASAKPLSDERTTVRAILSAWDTLQELEARVQAAFRSVGDARAGLERADRAAAEARLHLAKRLGDLEKAQAAWFRRAARVQRAARAVEEARQAIAKQDAACKMASKAEASAHELALKLEAAAARAREVCSSLPPRQEAHATEARLASELEHLEAEIRQLQAEISLVEQRLIQEARAIFCTLTKNYMAAELGNQPFDAVVVDEISMALPPLIFLAAARATKRVILVGDFLQLPPIVRSDSEISNARLSQDTFYLAGVARDSRPTDGCSVLRRLTTQRRMAPAIADAARHLAYGPDGIHDHAEVVSRQPPSWLDFLPPGALLVVDTADLNCWSGKQPGSLSRFNFYSATVAVELAAMAARAAPEPQDDEPPQIGIVTPFAAQRRLLSRLVLRLGLERWVLAGTVHTFQGSEADLIIFDAVLDEPYWSARLTTPSNFAEVMRELNVAVTRARHKLVLLASSEWLNNHAKPASALGQLWWFLKDRAPLVSACDLVEAGFAQRVSGATGDGPGWRLPGEAGVASHEILDETTFFERFGGDMSRASKSVFGLAPYFGEYRWPRVEPLFRAALERGVEITLVIPTLAEAQNLTYVDAVVTNLRRLGAVVVEAGGLHGKDIVIDESVHYTGSLNWASHRGRAEVMHRTESRDVARLVLEYIQARYIRAAGVHLDGTPRRCPYCGGSVWVVNQRQQHGNWDSQAMKVGCAAYRRTKCKYLRNIDERAPFRDAPRCQVDHVTKYRRVHWKKGEVWQCPKHPKQCETMKVVPGDPD